MIVDDATSVESVHLIHEHIGFDPLFLRTICSCMHAYGTALTAQ